VAGRASRGVERIKHIVGDLLDLSRARHGGVPVNFAPTDLNDICRQVIEEFEEAAVSRSIRLEAECAEATVVWDQHRVLQALSNLVGNAIQHSPPGSPVTVRIAAEREPLSVSVHNQGHIAEEIMPFLFNPFAAGEKSRGRTGGLGLGLFIAKAIAEAHGGDVVVDSGPDRGTTFSLVLPRRAVEARSACA
jgi:signal transduction histidine kinase